MAIDTANKRASVQAYFLGGMRPAPDGTVDAGDRATLGWAYSGLTYTHSAVAAPVLYWYQLDYGLYEPLYFQQLDTCVKSLCTANGVTQPVASWAYFSTGTLVNDWIYQVDTAVRSLCSLLSITPPANILSGKNTGQYESSYMSSLDTCVRALCNASVIVLASSFYWLGF